MLLSRGVTVMPTPLSGLVESTTSSHCVGGVSADGDTDVDGITEWSNALNAGGYSTANCHIMVSGDAITGGANGGVFALYFNSADMNGDGTVDIDTATVTNADIGVSATNSNLTLSNASLSGISANGVQLTANDGNE